MASVERQSGAHYLQRVSAIAEEITAATREIDSTGDIPVSVLDQLDNEGLFHLLLPRSLGGAALALPDFVLTVEALARLDASIAWVVAQTSGCSMVAAFMDPLAAARVFHSRPRGVLTWGPDPRARAVAAPGGYLVSGNFTFGSGSHVATWLGGLCEVYESDGKPRLGANGTTKIQHFLFPVESVKLHDAWRVIGLRGTNSDNYDVKDLFVPENMAVDRNDPQSCRDAAPLYRVASPTFYASTFGGLALGVARAMMDAFIAFAAKKTPRGDANPLATNPLTQYDVGLLETRLRAARSLHMSNVEAAWAEVQQSGALSLDRRVAVRMSGTHAFLEAAAVVEGLYHAAGSNAMLESYPFERLLRDIRGVTQQLHGRKAHYQTAGCYLMGGTPNTAFL